MSKQKLGLIGWRGMVGSVLIDRMVQENDFDHVDASFFSTSQAGEVLQDGPGKGQTLLDAKNLDALMEQEILISCQGGDYTKEIHPKLRERGWQGYWIDAASTLRMSPEAMICLDPLNGEGLTRALEKGVKDFIGGNCTVSLMLMGMGGLFKAGLVEFVCSQTYQAASGGGAQHMRELLRQMGEIHTAFASEIADEKLSILEIDRKLSQFMRGGELTCTQFGHPLAGNLLPWIDVAVERGQSREEWKAEAEANKILASKEIIPIDGTCVRVGAMRSHSQALMIKLKRSISLGEVESLIREHNPWVKMVANNPEASKAELTPVAISGTMNIGVGRLRFLSMGDTYLNAFTVGDQLLWGAAEPLRRMLRIITG